jgi:hypothetical protein
MVKCAPYPVHRLQRTVEPTQRLVVLELAQVWVLELVQVWVLVLVQVWALGLGLDTRSPQSMLPDHRSQS